uniref:Tensin n=1 Tax=Strigamia maritima TaxID=126957 RepID=T1IXC8_STRMM
MKLPSCTKPQGFDSHTHSFRSKLVHKQVTCQYCQQPITQLGSSCRICKYICHPECQPRVALLCDNSYYQKTKNYDGVKTQQSLHSPFYLPSSHQVVGTLPKSHSLPFSKHFTYHTTYRVPDRSAGDILEMDIIYITERVIVMTFPLVGNEKIYRENLREVTQMLNIKHGDKYMVFNLSERRYDLTRLNKNVMDFGWPDRLAPPLERICSICKSMDSWLNSDPQHIVVLHSKGGKERVGIVTEAYRHYSSICASTDQALDRFAMKRYYDDKIGNLSQPSQKRYIKYFSGLLSGAIRINSSPLYLHHVVITGVPNYDGKGGCKAFLKVYQGMNQMYSTGIYNITSNMGRVFIPLEVPLQLRGDIMLKCYHKARSTTREVIFRCQFHTCAISDHVLTLAKEELDDASQDKRFPADGRVEIKFSSGSEHFQGNWSRNGYEMPHPIESSTDPVVRWDSYENFDAVPEDNPETLEDLDLSLSLSSKHNQGPVDGNLYATVAKRRPLMNGNMEDLYEDIHTTSMDSGISSAAPLITNGTPSSQSPVTQAEIHTHPSYSSEQSKLDEVLTGMLLDTRSLPDIKPTYATYTVTTKYTGPETDKPPALISPKLVRKQIKKTTIDLSDDDDTPYHASKDSKPFSYLVPSSPSAQRKNLPGTTSATLTSTQLKVTQIPRREERYVTSPPPTTRREERYVVSPTPTTPEPKYGSDDELIGDPENWLHRQQQKLRDRREARIHADRHHREQRLLQEFKTTRHHLMPPSLADSLDDETYLSDTLASLEAFSSRETSPGKGGLTTPLHINIYNGYSTSQSSSPYVATKKPPLSNGVQGRSAPASPLIPARTSSRDVRVRYNAWPAAAPQAQLQAQLQSQPQYRPVQRQRSDTSHDRERPFVTVKRAIEQARKNPDQSPSYQHSYAYSYGEALRSAPPLATSSPADRTHEKPSGLLTTATPKLAPAPGTTRLTELEMSLQAVNSPVLVTSTPKPQTEIHRHLSPKMKRKVVEYSTMTDSNTYWSQDESSGKEEDRPLTPGFPVQPRTPYFNRAPSPSHQTSGLPPKSPTTSRKDRSPSPATIYQIRTGIGAHIDAHPQSQTGQSSPSVYFGQSRRNSISSMSDSYEVITHAPTFIKDTSKYWYKPNISREDAINLLKDKPPGSFIVRDSNSFPGAYGLALKVAIPPPNVQNKSGDMSNELVRHFLIEPTHQGVRLKGCSNEPVFGSLSALVYQHSITPMALPCKLLLPDADLLDSLLSDVTGPSSAAQLLSQGAACNVLYLYSVDIELLTGPEAVRKATAKLLAERPLPKPTVVHFKVSSQGITMTDSTRKLFFRRHYPVNSISHCGLEPGDRRWTQYHEETGQAVSTHRVFGFISSKRTDPNDNLCHLFAELEPEQPAFAIVNFVTKVMMMVPQTPSTPRTPGSVHSVQSQRRMLTAMSPEDAQKCCD